MKVIVAVDGGPQQPSALALGAQLASGDDDELVVAHAYAWSLVTDRIDAGHAAQVRERAQHLVDGAAAWLGGGRRVLTEIVADISIARGLHALAADEDADMLVIGSSHRGPVGRTLLGGLGERLVHGAPCRIAVAPRDFDCQDRSPGHIGVAFDGTPEARAALAWAADQAERTGAAVVVLTVFVPIWVPAGATGAPGYAFDDLERAQREEARQELDQTVAGLPATVRAEGRLLQGAVAHALAREASSLDMLVMGSRAYGPVRSVLLGGVSHRLVRLAPCPLIVLPRSAGAEEPAGSVALRGAAS